MSNEYWLDYLLVAAFGVLVAVFLCYINKP